MVGSVYRDAGPRLSTDLVTRDECAVVNHYEDDTLFFEWHTIL